MYKEVVRKYNDIFVIMSALVIMQGFKSRLSINVFISVLRYI